MDRCPKCESKNLTIEKRMDGKRWCSECGYILNEGSPLPVTSINYSPKVSRSFEVKSEYVDLTVVPSRPFDKYGVELVIDLGHNSEFRRITLTDTQRRALTAYLNNVK